MMTVALDMNFAQCPNNLKIVKNEEFSTKCTIYYNDIVMGYLTCMDSQLDLESSLDLNKERLYMIDVLLIENLNTSCQMMYLVDHNPKKRCKDSKNVENGENGENVETVITFYKKDDEFLDMRYLSVVTQTLIMKKKVPTKCVLNYKSDSLIYDELVKAACKHYSFNLKKKLNAIQKGYLYYLLKLYRKSLNEYVYEPFKDFNLNDEWMDLKYINVLLQTSPVNIHIELVNNGILFYLNVTSYLLESIRLKRWESLRSILSYYDCSKLINRDIIFLYLKNYPDAMIEMPKYLAEKVLNLKYKKSPLRHVKILKLT